MNDYYAPDSWYEAPHSDLNTCQSCEDTKKVIENSQYFLMEVMKMLYGQQDLDLAKLDDYLGELCYGLDVDMPAAFPQIERATRLKQWIDFNKQELQKLA